MTITCDITINLIVCDPHCVKVFTAAYEVRGKVMFILGGMSFCLSTHRDWMGYFPLPQLGLDGGTPPVGTGRGYHPPPLYQDWMGVTSRPPPSPPGMEGSWTGYAASGTPLAGSYRRIFLFLFCEPTP